MSASADKLAGAGRIQPWRSLVPEAVIIGRLGAGVALSQAAQIAMGLTDAAMLGRLGPQALGGGMLVTTLWVQIALFCMGTQMAALAIFGGAIGTGRVDRLLTLEASSRRLALFLSVGQVVLLLLVPLFIRLVVTDLAMASIASDYAIGLAIGTPAWLLYVSKRIQLVARGRTAPFVVASTTGVLVNAGLNQLLMFGVGPVPALGAFGSAISTSVTSWAMLGLVVLLARRGATPTGTPPLPKPEDAKPQREVVLLLLRQGWPIGLIFFSESLVFAVAAVLFARISPASIAAFGISQQWLAFVFMLPIGISQIVTTRVAQAIGADSLDRLGLALRAGLVLTTAYCFAAAAVLLAGAPLLAELLGASARTDPQLFQFACQDLRWVALLQLLNGLVVVIAGALRGFRDNRTPLAAVIRNYWVVGTGSTVVLGLAFGGPGIWLGSAMGFSLTLFSIASSLRRRLRDAPVLMRKLNAEDARLAAPSARHSME